MDQSAERKQSDAHSETAASGKEAMSAGKTSHLKIVKDDATSNMRAGDILRQARLKQNLEVADIARKLCLRQDYITAMENMHIKVLPTGSVRGFVSSYAKQLGLDYTAVVTQYTEECGSLSISPIANERNSAAPPVPPAEKEFSFKSVAASFLAIAAVGVSAVLFLTREQPVEQVAEAGNSTLSNGVREPLVYAEVSQARPNIDVLPVKIVALKRAWIEVRGADGTKFISRQMSANESYKPRLEAGWTVSTDDGGAFEWRLHDTSLAPLGTDGTPVYGLRIDSVARALTKQFATETAANSTASTQ